MNEMHVCDNCKWKGMTPMPVTDLEKRTEPGGLVPSGECPECGALCYPEYCDVIFVELSPTGRITGVHGPPWMSFVTIDPMLEDDPELLVHMRARRKLLHHAIESGRVVDLVKLASSTPGGEMINTYHKDPEQR